MEKERIFEKISDAVSIPEKITSAKEIQKLKLVHIKGIDSKIAQTLKNVLNVKTIEDLAKKQITEDNFQMLKLLGINLHDINVWTFISKMVVAGKTEEPFGPRKISIVGLDNAGKTALLNVLQNNVKLETFSKLVPTIGVNRETLEKFGLQYLILDMGGQEKYRSEYLENGHKYFYQVELLIFVIDVQDSENFETALNYLQEVIKIIELLKENPEFLIIINKVDPDIKDKQEIQDAFQFLKQRIDELFQDKKFQYEIAINSIYYSLGDNKSIIKDIRDFLTISPDKKQELRLYVKDSVERVLNMVINLNSTLETQFSKLENEIETIREWIRFQETLKPSGFLINPKEKGSSKEFQKFTSKGPLTKSLFDDLKLVLKKKET